MYNSGGDRDKGTVSFQMTGQEAGRVRGERGVSYRCTGECGRVLQRLARADV